MLESNRKRISGTMWSVYLYILTSDKPRGVREVWRGLNLSSPSLAQYHINKLLELKLIESTPDGKYHADEMGRMDVLRNFVLLRGKLIPRLVFYGGLILGIFLMYFFLWPFRWDFRDFVIIAVSIISMLCFFFEAYNQYKGLMKS